MLQQNLKIVVARALIAQAATALAPLEQDLVCANHDPLHLLISNFIVLQSLKHSLELQHQTIKTLQQRVVEFTRDAAALMEPFLQTNIVLPCDFLQAKPVPEP